MYIQQNRVGSFVAVSPGKMSQPYSIYFLVANFYLQDAMSINMIDHEYRGTVEILVDFIKLTLNNLNNNFMFRQRRWCNVPVLASRVADRRSSPDQVKLTSLKLELVVSLISWIFRFFLLRPYTTKHMILYISIPA